MSLSFPILVSVLGKIILPALEEHPSLIVIKVELFDIPSFILLFDTTVSHHFLDFLLNFSQDPVMFLNKAHYHRLDHISEDTSEGRASKKEAPQNNHKNILYRDEVEDDSRK